MNVCQVNVNEWKLVLIVNVVGYPQQPPKLPNIMWLGAFTDLKGEETPHTINSTKSIDDKRFTLLYA